MMACKPASCECGAAVAEVVEDHNKVLECRTHHHHHIIIDLDALEFVDNSQRVFPTLCVILLKQILKQIFQRGLHSTQTTNGFN